MPSPVPRRDEVEVLLRGLRRFPVVGILGPRQVGKSTLARAVAGRFRGRVHLFDLEDPATLARFAEPMRTLEGLRGLVVLDEVQRTPEIFPVLRVLADRRPSPARFLVLGSASPGLLRQSSESLAGRIHYHELSGFALDEVGADRLERLWVRGGFPLSFLASSEARSIEWRRDFIRTYLERDLPTLGIRVPSMTLRRFWTMLAHYHGQTWNSSEFARSLGVSDHAIRHYLDLLSGTFVVEQLRPWSENVGKRVVKAPRVFVADTGILHALLGLESLDALEGHPKAGPSWESFAAAAVRRRLRVWREDCYFWSTYSGAELDLLVVVDSRRYGFEIKRTAEPRITKSMRIAMEDLRLEELVVVHAGRDSFPLSKGIRAVALSRILEDLRPLR